MAIRITGDMITAGVLGRVVATAWAQRARRSRRPGAWTVSAHAPACAALGIPQAGPERQLRAGCQEHVGQVNGVLGNLRRAAELYGLLIEKFGVCVLMNHG